MAYTMHTHAPCPQRGASHTSESRPHACRTSAPHRVSRRHSRLLTQAQGDGSGGLLGGIGKMFGGGSKPQEEEAAGTRTVTQEVFMMANIDEDPEFPPFQVVSKAKDYQLRFYDVYPVVEMEYEQRQEGYAALGSFIDGDNAEGIRFAYTQPVVMRYSDEAGKGPKTMQMYLGSRKNSNGKTSNSVAALPAPNDSQVRVGIAGGELLAVAIFEGYITPTTAQQVRKQLLAALKRDGVKLSEEAQQGAFRVGQFGAVYQLSGRVNEIYIKVSL